MSSKKEILEKINKAKIVYIYNGHIDNYFKSSKSELLWHFRYLYKRQKTEPNYMNSFLKEFNDNINLNDNFELYFN